MTTQLSRFTAGSQDVTFVFTEISWITPDKAKRNGEGGSKP